MTEPIETNAGVLLIRMKKRATNGNESTSVRLGGALSASLRAGSFRARQQNRTIDLVLRYAQLRPLPKEVLLRKRHLNGEPALSPSATD
jgi:hypothetical protein